MDTVFGSRALQRSWAEDRDLGWHQHRKVVEAVEVGKNVSERRKQNQNLEETQHLKVRQRKKSLWHRLKGGSQRDGRKTVSVESGKQERRELWMEVDIFV